MEHPADKARLIDEEGKNADGAPSIFIFKRQMAKQAGHIKITGTRGNLTFYEMDGKYYVRMKSSLTGKMFRTKKCFAASRQSAARFAKGNQIASTIYRGLPKWMRVYDLFCALKSAAIGLLKEGMTEAEVKAALEKFVQQTVKRRKRLQKKPGKILQEIV